MKISHSALAKITAGALFVAGALLATVHSLSGAIGVAVVAAVVTGVVAGMLIARPNLGYAAGGALAALAAFAGGFLIVGVFAAFYAALVGRSLRPARTRPMVLAA